MTRDYGAERVLERTSGEVTETDTVMRVLEADADIETRYGGGFVQSIEGLEADEELGGAPYDWFFYVNGVESTVGAADFSLNGGERIWWDYRDWGAAMRVPAVVGSFPQPLAGGYDGDAHPVEVECLDAGSARLRRGPRPPRPARGRRAGARPGGPDPGPGRPLVGGARGPRGLPDRGRPGSQRRLRRVRAGRRADSS